MDASRLNGVSSFPTIPDAVTTYEPSVANSNGNSAITSPPAGAIPTVVFTGRSTKPVAALYSTSVRATDPST